MKMRASICFATAGLGAMLLSAAVHAQDLSPTTSCENLARLSLPDTSDIQAVPMRQAKLVQGVYQPPSTFGPGAPVVSTIAPDDATTVPDFCYVTAKVRTSSDTSVYVEFWLPLAEWNGSFLGLGSGPLAGGGEQLDAVTPTGAAEEVPNAGLGMGLRRGFAGGTVTMGPPHAHPAQQKLTATQMAAKAAYNNASHPAGFGAPGGAGSMMGNGGDSMIGHPQRLIDYGYRAQHVMAVVGKDFVQAFYGRAPKHAIFIGCSQGSQQAINEAGRYPGDYDGVIIGAMMNPIARYNLTQMYPAWIVAHDPAKAMSQAKFNMVHAAVIKACGTKVGMAQGFVEDPERCLFDPVVLQCKGPETPDCLTAKQVEAVREFYHGPVDPVTGELVFPGPARGAEGGYREMAANFPLSNSAVGLIRDGVQGDPNWDWKTMNYHTELEREKTTVDPVTYITPAMMKPFFDHGDKILFYEGWLDYHNAVITFDYYNAILKIDPAAADQMRVFAVPGMGHCDKGPGCDTFNKVGEMLEWLDGAPAPNEMLSYKLNDAGQVIRSRPICAYPKIAKYDGTGDMTKAASFSCITPPPAPPRKKSFVTF